MSNLLAAIPPIADVVVDPQLALWGLVSIGVILVVALIAFTIIVVVLLREKPDEIHDCIQIVISSERAIQLLTISVIVVALLFLGIAGRLTEGAIAILGSVGGYILGSLSKGVRPVATKESKSQSPAKASYAGSRKALTAP